MTTNVPQDVVLNALRKQIATMAYAADPVLDALTLQIAVGHAGNETFVTRGHFLVRAKKPKTGKTTLAGHVPALYVHNPWKVSKKTTDPAIMHKFLDVEPPTWIVDDAGKIFGDAGNNGKTSTIYSVLIDGYINDAIVSMSRNSVTQDVPAYVQAFINGLHSAVPSDLVTRCIKVNAVPRPPNVRLRSALHPDAKVEAAQLRKVLHVWVATNKKDMSWFALNRVEGLHPKLFDRAAQIWGPLFAVANSAGGDWPARCMSAFIHLELDESDQPLVVPEQQLVLDVASVLERNHAQRMFAVDIAEQLKLLPESIYGEVSDRRLDDMLDGVLGVPVTVQAKSVAGVNSKGAGWIAAPIFKQAREIRQTMFPETEVVETVDPSIARRTLIPIGE
jgi:Protein of unknown function (DUF3631)